MNGFPNMNNGSAFKNKPRALMCYICGREFGTASLQIHIKACIQKWEAVENQKPKRERRPLPQPPKEFSQVTGQGGNLNWNEIEQYNKQANEKWNDEALIRCEFCNRTFLPDRMPIHRKVCTQEKPFKPLPGAGVAKESSDNSMASTTTNSSKSSMSMGSNNVSQSQAIKPSGPSSKMGTSSIGGSGGGGPSSNPMGNSVMKSTDFGSNQKVSSGGGAGGNYSNSQPVEYTEDIQLVSCDLCGRNFAADRISRHITACAKAAKGEAKHQKKVAKAEAKQQDLEAFIAKEEKIKAKTTKWRTQHEDFQKAMEYNKKVKAIEQAGGDIRSLEPPPSSNTDHLIPCPYCGRKFADKTAERHIPKCKDVVNKPKPPPTKANVSSSMTTSSISKPTVSATTATKTSSNVYGGGSNPSSLTSKPVGKSNYDSPNPVSSKPSTVGGKSTSMTTSSNLAVSGTSKTITSANNANSNTFKAYQAKKTGAFNY